MFDHIILLHIHEQIKYLVFQIMLSVINNKYIILFNSVIDKQLS